MIKDNFKIPIKFIDNIPIDQHLITDLELLSTVNDDKKPIYHNIFNPTNALAINSINQWNCYTTNIKFLKDSQKLYTNINDLKEDKFYIKNMIENWDELKKLQNFKERFQYVEWDKISFLNLFAPFLYLLSFLNITAPLMQLVAPIMIFIMPFFLLKAMGIPISVQKYTELLKKMLQSNAIYNLLTKFKESTIKEKASMTVTVGLYFYNLWQNLLSCYRFYDNTFYIIEKLNSVKNYLKYTIDKMKFLRNKTENLVTYLKFYNNILEHEEEIEKHYDNMMYIPEKGRSLNTVKSYGYIMKDFYYLHNSEEFNNLIQYSFGFHGYINNIIGINENIQNKLINKTRYTKKNKVKFNKIYHPSISNKCIKNNVKLDKSIILTGPNAAGKTTLLKSTIINLLFSQQIGFGYYKKATINPFKYIHCYINIPDSCSRDSLFQAEVRRCKEILDCINNNPKERHFCVFDELYSGTNPYEAISAAYSYLNHIVDNNNIKFVLTTHYLKMCKLFSKHKKIENYKMDTFIDNNDKPIYSYKMIKGYSEIKGGISVLKELNYPLHIIDSAKKILNKL